MKYMGSKSKIAKYICPIIQNLIDENNISTYIEPFVGGCNIIDKIKCKEKIGCDIQEYLISLLQNLDKISQLPYEVTYEHYSDVRKCYHDNSDKYPKWYVGAIGFLSSYNGRFFDGGYSGVRTTKSGYIRNYYLEALNNLKEQIPNLQDVQFYFGDYKDICSGYKNCLIYCDPPYLETKQYAKRINYLEFWDWCREMSKDNIVIISEVKAPSDFKCIWQKEIKRTIDINSTKISNEKLFII